MRSRRSEPFPFLLLFVLLASAYLFWGVPAIQGPRGVTVDFVR